MVESMDNGVDEKKELSLSTHDYPNGKNDLNHDEVADETTHGAAERGHAATDKSISQF
jgi:hypothetical protein